MSIANLSQTVLHQIRFGEKGGHKMASLSFSDAQRCVLQPEETEWTLVMGRELQVHTLSFRVESNDQPMPHLHVRPCTNSVVVTTGT